MRPLSSDKPPEFKHKLIYVPMPWSTKCIFILHGAAIVAVNDAVNSAQKHYTTVEVN